MTSSWRSCVCEDILMHNTRSAWVNIAVYNYNYYHTGYIDTFFPKNKYCSEAYNVLINSCFTRRGDCLNRLHALVNLLQDKSDLRKPCFVLRRHLSLWQTSSVWSWHFEEVHTAGARGGGSPSSQCEEHYQTDYSLTSPSLASRYISAHERFRRPHPNVFQFNNNTEHAIMDSLEKRSPCISMKLSHLPLIQPSY